MNSYKFTVILPVVDKNDKYQANLYNDILLYFTNIAGGCTYYKVKGSYKNKRGEIDSEKNLLFTFTLWTDNVDYWKNAIKTALIDINTKLKAPQESIYFDVVPCEMFLVN